MTDAQVRSRKAAVEALPVLFPAVVKVQHRERSIAEVDAGHWLATLWHRIKAAQPDPQPHARLLNRACLRSAEPAGKKVQTSDDAGAQCTSHLVRVLGLQRTPDGMASRNPFTGSYRRSNSPGRITHPSSAVMPRSPTPCASNPSRGHSAR